MISGIKSGAVSLIKMFTQPITTSLTNRKIAKLQKEISRNNDKVSAAENQLKDKNIQHLEITLDLTGSTKEKITSAQQAKEKADSFKESIHDSTKPDVAAALRLITVSFSLSKVPALLSANDEKERHIAQLQAKLPKKDVRISPIAKENSEKAADRSVKAQIHFSRLA